MDHMVHKYLTNGKEELFSWTMSDPLPNLSEHHIFSQCWQDQRTKGSFFHISKLISENDHQKIECYCLNKSLPFITTNNKFLKTPFWETREKPILNNFCVT